LNTPFSSFALIYVGYIYTYHNVTIIVHGTNITGRALASRWSYLGHSDYKDIKQHNFVNRNFNDPSVQVHAMKDNTLT